MSRSIKLYLFPKLENPMPVPNTRTQYNMPPECLQFNDPRMGDNAYHYPSSDFCLPFLYAPCALDFILCPAAAQIRCNPPAGAAKPAHTEAWYQR